MSRFIFRFFTLFLCLFSLTFPLFSQQDLLTKNSVKEIMQEILGQHLGQHAMTAKILQNAVIQLIDQFDPERIYLLESEVSPYKNLSSQEQQQLLNQYRRNSFVKFKELAELFNKSILRARDFRKDQYRDIDALIRESNRIKPEEEFHPQPYAPFAKNLQELKSRQHRDILQFIAHERKRYGDSVVYAEKDKSILFYERTMQETENPYLFTDSEGKPLEPQEQENLFVLHLIKALAKSLDSHTTFMDQEEAYEMRVRLEKAYEGIGLVLETKNGGIFIKDFLENSPAKKSGKIAVGDQILKVDNRNISSLKPNQIYALLRGKRGTPVSILVKHTANITKSTENIALIKLFRDVVFLKEGRVTTSYVPYENGIIGTIKLHSFYQSPYGVTSEQDIIKALQELRKQGELKGLILDLRENTGGFLNQAVKVAGLFITNGVVVISKYQDGQKRYYRDVDASVYWDGPFVVLTSKTTASAAEIVAQALQDYGIAVIVGDEQTYGKGTIQNQTVTGNNSTDRFFKVTVGKYYTVSGKTPQLQGVRADVVVPGIWSLVPLGEKDIDPRYPADSIDPSYRDQLRDVERDLQPWFIQYYMPTLQQKTLFWKNMIPILKQKSEKRIAQDSEYQNLTRSPPDSLDEFLYLEKTQHREAVNVVKDMIQLQKGIIGSTK